MLFHFSDAHRFDVLFPRPDNRWRHTGVDQILDSAICIIEIAGIDLLEVSIPDSPPFVAKSRIGRARLIPAHEPGRQLGNGEAFRLSVRDELLETLPTDPVREAG